MSEVTHWIFNATNSNNLTLSKGPKNITTMNIARKTPGCAYLNISGEVSEINCCYIVMDSQQ